MTIPNDNNLESADARKKRSRFRIEVTPELHRFLRQSASQKGKNIKEVANEIFQAYLENNPPFNGFSPPSSRDPD